MVELALEEDLETKFRVAVVNDDDDQIAELLQYPNLLLGLSDAGAHTSQLCDANYATWLLEHWWRTKGTLSLEQAVWRLTGHPASVLGMSARGLIAPGCHADLVAFDPDTVGTGPAQRVHDFPGGCDRLVAPSTGIVHTWVNGEAIWADGSAKPDVAAGRLLRNAVLMSARREEIIAVAKGLFAKQGYATTSMRDIAEACDLLAGSLYSHFRSKAQLLELVILPFYDELIPGQQAALELPGSGADRIEEMLRRVLAVCADHDAELTILHYDWSHLVEIDELAGVIARSNETLDLWERAIDMGHADGSLRPSVTARDRGAHPHVVDSRRPRPPALRDPAAPPAQPQPRRAGRRDGRPPRRWAACAREAPGPPQSDELDAIAGAQPRYCVENDPSATRVPSKKRGF